MGAQRKMGGLEVRNGLRSRTVATALGVAVALTGVAGCEGDVGLTEPGAGADGGAPSAKPAGQDVRKARSALSGLRIASEGSGSGYARTEFGVRWKDTDRNGCDQRNDVLARDLESVERQGKCVVVAGKLDDPYSGKSISFRKADAAEVQIDHVIPLALAWRMGAARWAEDKREKFANDPANLLAVWGVPNRQKSDKGPADWKPQKAFQCAYGVRYVQVADSYGLPVTRADHDALQDFLSRC